MGSGRFILGEEVDGFEREFAAYCGAAHCIGVGTGLDALSILLRAHGVGPGDEVVVPAHTFIATWLAVTACGAIPVPAPVKLATGNLDPARVEEAIGERCSAVVAVHLYGQTADMTALRDITARRGLLLLEDAAQAQGATWRGARAGALGDGAAFSFYPGKNLGALGDAGAITTDDPRIAERCRLLRNYGSPEKYVHTIKGQNSRLDELQASFLRVKLRHLDAWNERRRAAARRYTAQLQGVALPEVADGAEAVWHLYVVRTANRERLQRRLAEAGIETLVHYPIAPHESGAYADERVEPDHVREAELLSRTVLSLPIGPHLSEHQAGRVISAVAAAQRG
jgi:dTDP-4-amino-4,6-dideoxygalactose transaminase